MIKLKNKMYTEQLNFTVSNKDLEGYLILTKLDFRYETYLDGHEIQILSDKTINKKQERSLTVNYLANNTVSVTGFFVYKNKDYVINFVKQVKDKYSYIGDIHLFKVSIPKDSYYFEGKTYKTLGDEASCYCTNKLNIEEEICLDN